MKKMTKKESRETVSRSDGWVNLLAGLGKRGVDKTESTRFGEFTVLSDGMLTSIWMGEGLGNRVISVVADDMTRNGISIEGDTDGKLQKEMDRLKYMSISNTALKWMRLYRGALVVLGIRDGGKLEDPVGKTSQGIDWIKIYPAERIQVNMTQLVQNPASPYFEDIEVYEVQKLDGVPFRVHASRCMVFKGDPVPHTGGIDFESRYWGTSALQAPWNSLKNFGAIEQGLSNAMLELTVGKFKLSNLAQLLSENNTEAVYNRMQIINASKSILNAVLLGENEDYIRDTLSLAGAADLWDRYMIMLSATTGIPVTRLFGRSPAGLNATGESDLRTYYDMIQAKQEAQFRDPLQTLLNRINSYMNIVSGNPEFTFKPVWGMTEKETLDARKTQAETDQIYLANGVLTSEEVARNRFVNGYSFDTSIEDHEFPDEEEEEEEDIPGTGGEGNA